MTFGLKQFLAAMLILAFGSGHACACVSETMRAGAAHSHVVQDADDAHDHGWHAHEVAGHSHADTTHAGHGEAPAPESSDKSCGHDPASCAAGHEQVATAAKLLTSVAHTAPDGDAHAPPIRSFAGWRPPDARGQRAISSPRAPPAPTPLMLKVRLLN